MILTCPQCATDYLVDDARIGIGGRSVKCAACGTRWQAHAEDGKKPPGEPGAVRESAVGPAAQGDAAGLAGEDISKVFRARVNAKRRVRQAAISGAAWGAGAVAVALVVVLSVVFRRDVVRAWPGTAAAYASVGLPVNRIGLVIEQVHAEPTLMLSHAALSVTGSIRNVEDRAVRSPPLRIVLYNARGKRVAGQIAVPADPRVPPGRARRFMVTIFDPPLTAYALEVGFAPESDRRFAVMQPARQSPLPAAPAPGLRGAVAPASPPPPTAAPSAPNG